MSTYKTLLDQAQKLHRHARQGSYRTRQRYYQAFIRFIKFVAEEYHLQKLANLNSKHLKSYVKYMHEKNLAASTMRTELAAIKFYYDQIPDPKHKLPDNTDLDLENRDHSCNDRTWSKEEFQHIVREAMDSGKHHYPVILNLMLHLGLRIHEVFRLDAATARAALKDGVISIRGKGGKLRSIKLSPVAALHLERQLAVTRPGAKLFVADDVDTHVEIKLFQDFVVKHRLREVDGPDRERNTPHGLRSNFACNTYLELIAAGYTDQQARRKISKLIGHNRADVVRVYLAHIEKGDVNLELA